MVACARSFRMQPYWSAPGAGLWDSGPSASPVRVVLSPRDWLDCILVLRGVGDVSHCVWFDPSRQVDPCAAPRVAQAGEVWTRRVGGGRFRRRGVTSTCTCHARAVEGCLGAVGVGLSHACVVRGGMLKTAVSTGFRISWSQLPSASAATSARRRHLFGIDLFVFNYAVNHGSWRFHRSIACLHTSFGALYAPASQDRRPGCR